MKVFSPRLALLSLAVLSGCSTQIARHEIDEEQQFRKFTAEVAIEKMHQRVGDKQARAAAQDVQRPWIAGNAKPLAREVTLPAALRSNVNTTVMFSNSTADLPTIAERIQLATGILVQVKPEALLPPDDFVERVGEERSGDSNFVSPPPTTSSMLPPIPSPLPGMGASLRASGPSRVGALPMPRSGSLPVVTNLPRGTQPLPTLLDAVALRLGISWKYDHDLQAIVFFRTETRTFTLLAPSLDGETDISYGLSGSEGEDGLQLNSTAQVKFKRPSSQPSIESTTAKIERFLTRAGRVVAAGNDTNTIIVTDTPEALDRVAKFMEQQNRMLSRMVYLRVETVTLESTHEGQAGIDWNLLFTSGGAGNVASLVGVPAGLGTAGMQAANLGFTAGSGQWAGSSVAVTALSKIGRVVKHDMKLYSGQNRSPIPVNTARLITYVKDMQQTPSSSDTFGPTISLTQEEKTVGDFLTIVPNAQDDGQIILTVAANESRLVEMQREEFGTGQNLSFVQQPIIDSSSRAQQFVVKPGRPMIVAAQQLNDQSYTKRRLDDRAPLLAGGSDATNKTQRYVVTVVTADVQDSF